MQHEVQDKTNKYKLTQKGNKSLAKWSNTDFFVIRHSHLSMTSVDEMLEIG